MFDRAGGGYAKKKSRMSEIVSAIGDLTSALLPKLAPPSTSEGNPSKIIDNRGKCCEQLTEEEYTHVL